MIKCYPFIIKNDPDLEKGYANGYVAVPKNHPLYKNDWDDLDIDIHGGITSIETFHKDPNIIQLTDDVIPEDSWVFGFDTQHFLDNRKNWNRGTCINETLKLCEFLQDYSD